MLQSLGLRARLILIVVLAIVPALVPIAWNGVEERRAAYAEAEREAMNYARLLEAEHAARNARALALLQRLSRLPELRGYRERPEACSRLLADLRASLPEYANLGVVAPDGRVLCSAVPLAATVNFADRQWFRDILQSGMAASTDYVIGRLTRKPVKPVGAPLKDGDGSVRGVLFASIDLDWIGDFMASLQVPQDTAVNVIDARGSVLYRQPEAAQWIGRDVSASAPWRALAGGRREITLHGPGLDGLARITAALPFFDAGDNERPTLLLLSIPSGSIDAEIFNRVLRNLLWGLGALAAAILIAWRLGGRLVERPVSRLVAEKDQAVSHNALLQAVSDSENAFIGDTDPQRAFQRLVDNFVRLTGSEYGLIGEIAGGGPPSMRVLALSDGLDWQALSGGGEVTFSNPASLLGAVFARGETVVSNAPAHDPRQGGRLPPGHPPLAAFLGLPLFHAGRQVGMIGLANRPGGYDAAAAAALQPLLDTAAMLIQAYRSEARRRQAEAALQALNEQLEERVQQRTAEMRASLAELESFSYSVSHDLRGPLRGINGFAKILAEDYGERLDAAGRGHLARIAAAAERLGELIDDLIELAQLTRAPMRSDCVDLSALAAQLAEELRQEDPARRVDFAIAPGLAARGDPTLLRVALVNLLGNAWKYTARQADARIELGRARHDGRTAFYVRDNGAGFDMSYAGKLFKPFQRLHQPGEYSGSGIGLATVRRIIVRHGGDVWAEGMPGKGATFWFTLPAA